MFVFRSLSEHQKSQYFIQLLLDNSVCHVFHVNRSVNIFLLNRNFFYVRKYANRSVNMEHMKNAIKNHHLQQRDLSKDLRTKDCASFDNTNRQQPSPLLYSIEIWPARNSRLTQRETNHYITRCTSELAWPYLAGSSSGQLVI